MRCKPPRVVLIQGEAHVATTDALAVWGEARWDLAPPTGLARCSGCLYQVPGHITTVMSRLWSPFSGGLNVESPVSRKLQSEPACLRGLALFLPPSR